MYRLAHAGVRVPQPYNFFEGVLLMELVTDEHGDAAPRLNDCSFTPDEARRHHASLLTEVVRMLCAGVVHGDLSEFNILLGADGPVIIDLPQAVDAAGNNHAQRMLLRDVGNLRNFFARFAPELRATAYGPELWTLYERGTLSVQTVLTGHYERPPGAVDLVGGDARDRRCTCRRGGTAGKDGLNAPHANAAGREGKRHIFRPLGPSMTATSTFRHQNYEFTCGARAGDGGRFRPTLTVTKVVWPTRPRVIDVEAGEHETEAAAIAAARAQGIEWVNNYG